LRLLLSAMVAGIDRQTFHTRRTGDLLPSAVMIVLGASFGPGMPELRGSTLFVLRPPDRWGVFFTSRYSGNSVARVLHSGTTESSAQWRGS
jgi:hypothetical protein